MTTAATTELHAAVSGHVQGVGYRAFVERRAGELRLRGFVRNRNDGTVEVHAAGDPAAIESLRSELGRGPATASVASVAAIPRTPVAHWLEFSTCRSAADFGRRDRALAARVSAAIIDVPDFPKPGIVFKDVTPVLADPSLYAAVVAWIAERVVAAGADCVAAIESRGFIFGAPAAVEAGLPFVPIRKPGKLPRPSHREAYALEYGDDALCMHEDACANRRVVVVDDVLATGGTAAATQKLVERGGGEAVASVFLLEIDALNGRSKLGHGEVRSLIRI